MPSGSPSRHASPSRISVPAMAFALPPPGSPPGFGRWEKNSTSPAVEPCHSRTPRIRTRGRTTMPAALAVTAPITALTRCRLRVLLTRSFPHRHLAAGDAPHQEPGEGVDGEREDEQEQPDLDERPEIEAGRRLRELLGEHPGHRVTRREQREVH